jgi:hypothetical protein
MSAPARFDAVLERLLDETEPEGFDAREWRARIQTPTTRCTRRAAGQPNAIQGADPI